MNQEPIVTMQGIEKSSGAAKVLRGVAFEVHAGQVHALLGGNGTGKSTLMKILMGIHRADAGRILLDGRDMTFATVVETLRQGVVAMIFQELSLLPNLTVADNIFLGREPLAFGLRVDRNAIRTRTEALIAAQGFDIPPLAHVGDLPIAQRQQVKIIKATSRGARVHVMDEPTSSLTAREEEKLFELIGGLTRSGIGIVYISHRMSKIFKVSNQITVLRDEAAIGPVPTHTATVTENPPSWPARTPGPSLDGTPNAISTNRGQRRCPSGIFPPSAVSRTYRSTWQRTRSWSPSLWPRPLADPRPWHLLFRDEDRGMP